MYFSECWYACKIPYGSVTLCFMPSLWYETISTMRGTFGCMWTKVCLHISCGRKCLYTAIYIYICMWINTFVHIHGTHRHFCPHFVWTKGCGQKCTIIDEKTLLATQKIYDGTFYHTVSISQKHFREHTDTFVHMAKNVYAYPISTAAKLLNSV